MNAHISNRAVRPHSGGSLLRLSVRVLTDSSGFASLEFGPSDIPRDARFDHILIAADPTEAPDEGWNTYLREPGGVDILNGAGEDLAADACKVIRPLDGTQGAGTYEPVRVRQPWELIVTDAGDGKAALIVLYLISPY